MRPLASQEPLACVIGSIDLVRPLGLAGVESAVVARPGSLVRYSRFARHAIDWVDPWKQPRELLDRLLRFAEAQPEPPVLYYQGDWDLLLVSRHRDDLGEKFRFAIPDAELVEDLTNKARFRALADRLALPIPTTRLLDDASDPDDIDLPFPAVVKPLTRQVETWSRVSRGAKALRVETPAALRELISRLRVAGVDALAQELIPGPETLIESYHAYVDERGEVLGEFTGRKIRTYPAEFGFSTALETTDSADVTALGRELVGRLGFRGVVKFDFKRKPGDRLYLLEVNPRFNLWHHLGAVAGVNLPALVYDDLVGRPHRPSRPVRPGATWCHHRYDVRAARSAGVPVSRWARWALQADAKPGFARDDPLPVVRALLWRGSTVLQRASHATRRRTRYPG